MGSFREAPSADIQFYSSDPKAGHSNFAFVDQHFGSKPVVRRIFSIARKLGFQSLSIESLTEDACSNLALENESLRLRSSNFTRSRVWRICFYKTPEGNIPGEENGDFLGYCIIKKDVFSSETDSMIHVYEAVIQSPRTAEQNNFVHLRREYPVRTPFGVRSVRGVLYAQQNDRTFVCAHVALRAILATCLPEADITYSKINALLGIDHQNRKLGAGEGLSPDEIQAVLNHHGIAFETLKNEPDQQVDFPGDFQRELYGIIESRRPALLGFQLDSRDPSIPAARHLIPVIGHTFNEDTWVADAARAYFAGGLHYYPSENWLSTFLIHDDNFGPWLCLPRHYLAKKNFRLMIGITAKPLAHTSTEIEAIALSYFSTCAQLYSSEAGQWLGRFCAFSETGLLVLRTIHVTKTQYLAHLNATLENDPEAANAFLSPLPETFWMVEASAPELFAASRRKFGEVLLSDDVSLQGHLDLSLLIAFRLPGVLANFQNGCLTPQILKNNHHAPLFS